MMKKILLYNLALLLIANYVQAVNPVISNLELFGKPAWSTSVPAGSKLRVDYDFTDDDGDNDDSYIRWFRDIDGDGVFDSGDGDTYVQSLYASDPNSKIYTTTLADVGEEISVQVQARDDHLPTPENGNTLLAGGTDATVSGAYTNEGSTSDITITSTPAVPYLNLDFDTNYDLTVTGDGTVVTVYGDLTTDNQNVITVGAGATLIIYGNVSAGTKLDFIVEEGGTLEIYSGFEAVNNALITITGDVKVTGDFTTQGGGSAVLTVNAGGSLGVTGDIDVGDTDPINNYGNVQAGGTITPLAGFEGDGGTVTQNNPDPLPIELTSFKAAYTENAVTIYWQTAVEENNEKFTIERSKDGINYNVIAEVAGAGNSLTTLNYSYTDNNPLQGISYYKLTQTDSNGDSETFNPISVAYINEGDLKIGPNPAQNTLSVSVGGEVGSGIIKLYNLTGTVVKQVNMNSNHSLINISDLPAGTYMMVIAEGYTNISRRIIKE